MKVGREVVASAVGPAARKPNAVVDTTSADRRALDNSAIFVSSVAVVFLVGSVIVVDDVNVSLAPAGAESLSLLFLSLSYTAEEEELILVLSTVEVENDIKW
jgi:hypothetical protein